MKLVKAMKYILFILCLLFSTQEARSQPQPKPDSAIVSGKKYPVLTGARGGKYILVISKTGTVYKKYLPTQPKQKP